MKINMYPEYIFWSYKKDADLSVKIVARQVILYGDIEDIQLLFKIVSKKVIETVLNDLERNFKNGKRITFIREIFLK